MANVNPDLLATFRDKPKRLQCRSCGEPFVHTVDDQIRGRQLGFYGMPKWCPDCREGRHRDRRDVGPARG